MATPQFTDEIKFRCERALKARLKKVAKIKGGPFAKYQAVERDALREFVASEEVKHAGKAPELAA